MQGHQIGKLAFNTPAFQAYLFFIVVLLGGFAILVLRAADGDDPQGNLMLPYVIVGVLVAGVFSTVRVFRSHILGLEIDEELNVKTLFGTEVFFFSQVAGMRTGLLTSQTAGILSPLRKAKPLGVLLVVELNSGRELLCTIAPTDVDLVTGFLEQHKGLDLASVESLSTPRALVKEFSDAVVEERLGGAQRFFAHQLEADEDIHDTVVMAAEYAVALKQIIDENWFLDFAEISDKAEEASPYCLLQESDAEISASSREIMIQVVLRNDEGAGVWRFGRETTELIRAWLQRVGDDDAEA